MGIKITIKNEDNNTEKEISLGMSEKTKRNLKFLGKTTGKTVNSSAEKVGSFIEELVANEGEEVIEAVETFFARVKERMIIEDTFFPDKQTLAKRALEKKINQIPEGKLFTLEEYLDYTDEFDWEAYAVYDEEYITPSFLNIIRYPSCSISKIAFKRSTGLEKISYINLAQIVEAEQEDLKNSYPAEMIDEDFIIETLKKSFDKWLEERQDIGKYCTDASLMKLIKYFKSKVLEFREIWEDEDEENDVFEIPEDKTMTLAEYFGHMEEYLFDKPHADSYEKALDFLDKIIYPLTECSISAFSSAIYLSENMSYKDIASKFVVLPGKSEEEKVEILERDFNTWLERRPDVKKYCKNVNLRQLLIYYKSKVLEFREILENEDEENDVFQIPQDKTMTLSEYFGYMEEYLFDNPNVNSYEKAMDFMNKINYPITEASISAFASAIFLSKNMSYKDIASKCIVPGKTEEEIVEMLKKDFNTWLERRPDIKKQCTNANLRQLLIYYKKKATENVSKN